MKIAYCCPVCGHYMGSTQYVHVADSGGAPVSVVCGHCGSTLQLTFQPPEIVTRGDTVLRPGDAQVQP
jgi:hypothetical protein